MKNKIKIIRVASRSFIVLSALSLAYVSLMALFDPQSVMDLVQVKLENNDAYSSIRGVYGGVGATIVAMLLYLLVCHIRLGLGFLCMLWGSYALSRLITIFSEGPLGEFGNTWIVVETVLFTIALCLFVANKRKSYQEY